MMDPLMDRPGTPSPSCVGGPKKDPGLLQSASPTHRELSRLESLPVELLIQVMDNFSPDNVEPHLSDATLCTYKQAQKDLRMVCLVSKRLDAVGRQSLYQRTFINNPDALACLLRSLDQNKSLGQQVKHLWLVVPFEPRDPHYREPNVSILKSCSSLSKITDKGAEKSDFDAYKQATNSMRGQNSGRGRNEMSIPTFSRWIERKGCEILSLMYIETLCRTNKVESLCFGKICMSTAHYMRPYLTTGIGHGLWKANKLSVPFMVNLKSMQVLGDNNYRAVRAWPIVEEFLRMPGLQVLKAFCDSGNSFSAPPVSKRWGPSARPGSDRQWTSITRIYLEQSRCRPEHIMQMCTAFPSLECLSISTTYKTNIPNFEELASEQKFLSSALAKLEHLTKLVLDLRYEEDVRPLLGPHGALSLAGLDRLVSLRLPLQFLVEMPQPGDSPVIADSRQALPSSVEHLTLTADWQCVRNLALNGDAFVNWLHYVAVHGCEDAPATYRPRHALLDLLESISGHVPEHFKNLKGVSYHYSRRITDQGLLCRCSEDYTCIRCDPCRALSPYRDDDDSGSRMEILSGDFEDCGIRVRVIEEDS